MGATRQRVHRIRPGDEAAAIAAIHRLKPAAERDGLDASMGHMRRLLEREENILFVATIDERPVGFLLAYRVPRVDRDRDMVYLYEIEVRREYRRQGIGMELIERLKEECRRHPVLKIWVGTEIDNRAARSLFEATGATIVGDTYAEYVYTDL